MTTVSPLEVRKMEVVWVRGKGFNVSIAPRFALWMFGLLIAVKAPDYIPGILSIFSAVQGH